MKTIQEILMAAPPSQVTRCKIAMVEIAHAHWGAAASTLEDAINESGPGEWARDCAQMRDFCLSMYRVKCEGIQGMERTERTGATGLLIETETQVTLFHR